jgi:hypothetical protein
MGRLDALLSSVPGHFRVGEEDQFPWSATGSGIWYALVVVEDGKLQRYGFTAAKSQRSKLVEALRLISDQQALLLGVWTGQYRTDLFVLDVAKAITRLSLPS